MVAPAQIRGAASKVPAFSTEVVVRHLVRRGLITCADVVNGMLSTKNVSRRNHVFAIIRDNGESYLLKQGIGRDRISTLEREALAYERFGVNPHVAQVGRYLPRSYGYEAKPHVLVVEFLREGEDLRSYCTKHHRFPAGIAAELGRALAAFHRTDWSVGPRKRRLHSRPRPPWIFSQAPTNLRTFCNSSAGTIELLRLLQEFRDFRRHFGRLRGAWKAESFIHFDLRWDNCIVLPKANGKADLKIVDWELAGRGDPRWDVGTIFSNFLSFWVGGIPVPGDSRPDLYLDSAEMPLERLQPAIRAFWASYAREARVSRGESKAWLLRAVEYSAAHLVQTAVEQMQGAADLSGGVACLLQLSLNILQRPQKAATQLLAIPLA